MSRKKCSSAIYVIRHNLHTPPEYVGFITDTRRKIEKEVRDYNSITFSNLYFQEYELVECNLFPRKIIVPSHQWVNRPKYRIIHGEDIFNILDENLDQFTEDTKNYIRKFSDLSVVKAFTFINEYPTDNLYFKVLKLFLEEELDIRGYNTIKDYRYCLLPDDSKLPIFKK